MSVAMDGLMLLFPLCIANTTALPCHNRVSGHCPWHVRVGWSQECSMFDLGVHGPPVRAEPRARSPKIAPRPKGDAPAGMSLHLDWHRGGWKIRTDFGSIFWGVGDQSGGVSPWGREPGECVGRMSWCLQHVSVAINTWVWSR